MKKIIYFCLICACVLLTGCAKEKDTFEHYDLKDKDLNTYVYHSDERGKEIYVLADLTPDNYESSLTGFFYKVDDNDYILLDTLESSHLNAYKKDSMYRFYDNKLYGVGNGNTPLIFEIELKGKNSTIKEIELKVDNKKTFILTPNIKDINKNRITLFGLIFIGEHSEGKYFDCSLKDFECSIID